MPQQYRDFQIVISGFNCLPDASYVYRCLDRLSHCLDALPDGIHAEVVETTPEPEPPELEEPAEVSEPFEPEPPDFPEEDYDPERERAEAAEADQERWGRGRLDDQPSDRFHEEEQDD